MKIKILSAIAAIAFVVCAASCTTTRPHTATSNELGNKVGEATAGLLFNFIPIPPSQDTGIQKAARNGNITKISTVDIKTWTFPGIWSSTTTIVTGE